MGAVRAQSELLFQGGTETTVENLGDSALTRETVGDSLMLLIAPNTQLFSSFRFHWTNKWSGERRHVKHPPPDT